jgi:hypothetical protein
MPTTLPKSWNKYHADAALDAIATLIADKFGEGE